MAHFIIETYNSSVKIEAGSIDEAVSIYEATIGEEDVVSVHTDRNVEKFAAYDARIAEHKAKYDSIDYGSIFS